MKNKSFSKKEALKFGWQTMKKNFIFVVSLLLIVFLLNFFLSLITNRFSKEGSFFISSIIFILEVSLTLILSLGWTNISLKLYDNKKAKIKDLFSCYNLFFKYLFGMILYALTIFGGFIFFIILYFKYLFGTIQINTYLYTLPILGGLILFIIPGIIFAVRFYFFGHFIVDKKYGPIQALKESFSFTQKHFWNLFSFFIIIFIFLPGLLLIPSSLLFISAYVLSTSLALPNILSAITGIIGLFLLIILFLILPIINFAQVFVYRKLIDLSKENKEDISQGLEINKESIL